MSSNLTEKMILESTKAVTKEIYDDGFKPAVKEVGKALETIVKLENLLLSPFRLVAVTGDALMEKATGYLFEKINQKNIPVDSLVDPPWNVVVPTLRALQYNIEIEELREILINLLATSIDPENNKKARSAFVVTATQLEPLDVRIFHELFLNRSTCQYSAIGIGNKHFLNFFNLSMLTLDNVEEIENSIENLNRLGLISINQRDWFQEDVSEITKNSLIYNQLYEKARLSDETFSSNPLTWYVTKYGHSFADACLI